MRAPHQECRDAIRALVNNDIFQSDSRLFQEHALAYLLSSLYCEDPVRMLETLTTILSPRIDFTNRLPVELVLHIFSFLGAKDLCELVKVNKLWSCLAEDNSLWAGIYEREWRATCSSSCQDPSMSLSLSPFHSSSYYPSGRGPYSSSAGGMKRFKRSKQAWKEQCRSRARLEYNWRHANFKTDRLIGHHGWVRCLALSGERLISGSEDRTIRVWNVGAPKAGEEDEEDAERSVRVMIEDLSEGGGRPIGIDGSVGGGGSGGGGAGVGMEGTVRAGLVAGGVGMLPGGVMPSPPAPVGVAEKRCVMSLQGHENWVMCLQVAWEQGLVVSGSEDRTIKLWSLSQGGRLVETLEGHNGGVYSLQFAAENNRLISGATDFKIKIWECGQDTIGDGTSYRQSPVSTFISSSGLSSSSSSSSSSPSSSSTSSNSAAPSSSPKRECLHTLNEHTRAVVCLKFDGGTPKHGGSYRLLSGSWDRTICVWDLQAAKCIKKLSMESEVVCLESFQPSVFAYGAGNGQIAIFDLRVGQESSCVQQFHVHTDWVDCIQWKGNRIVSGSEDKTIKIWDIRQLEQKGYGSGIASKKWRGRCLHTFAENFNVLDLQFDEEKLAWVSHWNIGLKSFDVN